MLHSSSLCLRIQTESDPAFSLNLLNSKSVLIKTYNSAVEISLDIVTLKYLPKLNIYIYIYIFALEIEFHAAYKIVNRWHP